MYQTYNETMSIRERFYDQVGKKIFKIKITVKKTHTSAMHKL